MYVKRMLGWGDAYGDNDDDDGDAFDDDGDDGDAYNDDDDNGDALMMMMMMMTMCASRWKCWGRRPTGEHSSRNWKI